MKRSTDVPLLPKEKVLLAKDLKAPEARFLISDYYLMQDQRIRSNGQLRHLGDKEEHGVLDYAAKASEVIENQIKRALEKYAQGHPIGRWLLSVHGIGPVIAAGLLAHIDIEKAQTAGAIWRFAGLAPGQRMQKGEKRSWNAELKTVCWHAGQCFMRAAAHPDCAYGRLYREQKAKYVSANEAGAYADRAAEILTAKKFNKGTDAYKHYSSGKLPPAHIDAMARRWAVKIFLSHLHAVWYEWHFGIKPPAAYPIAILGHAHNVEDTNDKPDSPPASVCHSRQNTKRRTGRRNSVSV